MMRAETLIGWIIDQRRVLVALFLLGVGGLTGYSALVRPGSPVSDIGANPAPGDWPMIQGGPSTQPTFRTPSPFRRGRSGGGSKPGRPSYRRPPLFRVRCI